MYNLIRFEILKRKKMFSILGILFLLMQVFIIYKTSISTTADINIMGTGVLLIFISYIVFMFSSLLTFSRDINSTDRSIVFMTPYSGFTIISSKFLTTIILGIMLVLITFIWFVANAYYVEPQTKSYITQYIQDGDFKTTTKVLVLSFVSIGSFFSLVFLSIIITKTFLSRLKFRTLIIIVVMFVLSKIFNLIFWDNLNEISSLNAGISVIAIIFITTLMLWICGWLVDNKTDF